MILWRTTGLSYNHLVFQSWHMIYVENDFDVPKHLTQFPIWRFDTKFTFEPSVVPKLTLGVEVHSLLPKLLWCRKVRLWKSEKLTFVYFSSNVGCSNVGDPKQRLNMIDNHHLNLFNISSIIKFNKYKLKTQPMKLDRKFTRRLGEIQFSLRFHGPPTPAGPGPCGFHRQWFLVVI